MKKAFLVLGLLGAMAASADSYLYWMVDSGVSDYAYARIRTSDGAESYLTVYDEYLDSQYNEATYHGTSGQSGVSAATVADAADYSEGFYAALGSISPSSVSYIIELYNESGTFISQSELSGSAAAAYVWNGGISAPPAIPWTAASFAIPEPSSGLLTLVGCALLGLRRRRQKKA